MSQQADAGDWWQRLYEESAPDGPREPGPPKAADPDTVDTRFAAAARIVTPAPPDPLPAPPGFPDPLPLPPDPPPDLPDPPTLPPAPPKPPEAPPETRAESPAKVPPEAPTEELRVVAAPPAAAPDARPYAAAPARPPTPYPTIPDQPSAAPDGPPPAPDRVPTGSDRPAPAPDRPPVASDRPSAVSLPVSAAAPVVAVRSRPASGHPLGVPGPYPAAGTAVEPDARPLIPAQHGGPPAPTADGTGFALGDVSVPPPPPPPEPPPAARPAPRDRYAVEHLGERPPTYEGEPGALPHADPADLTALVPDTVLEGARHGTYTLRAASVRGDSARYRGEPRRDFLLTARFGTGDDALVLVAAAGGDRAADGAHEADAELCRWIAGAVGRSQARLGADIRAGRRDDLRSGLQRLTDRGYGRLRACDAPPPAGLRCLLLPIDPECRTRVAFGTGAGGLFRLRDGDWQDLESGPAGEGGFRFRASVARPGDALLLCTGGLAAPMREEAELPAELAVRWGPAAQVPPGLAAFLADTTLRLKGYADDRTAAAVWET